MARIAVEESLDNICEALRESGHEIVPMENAAGADCCVVSGQDKNLMGMTDISTKASVINAEGMTAEEVLQQVNQRIGMH